MVLTHRIRSGLLSGLPGLEISEISLLGGNPWPGRLRTITVNRPDCASIGPVADRSVTGQTGGSGDALVAALEGAAGGDQQAFARFYDLISPMVYGLVLRVIRNPALAEEVTQEVFVELWRLAPRYDSSKGSPRAWASAIAHRRAVDRVRSEQAARNRDERDGQSSSVPHDSVVEAVETKFDHERVGKALGQLGEAQREALTLAFYGGHTYVNVARMLSVPEGTIKTRIRDGLARIRDIMEAP